MRLSPTASRPKRHLILVSALHWVLMAPGCTSTRFLSTEATKVSEKQISYEDFQESIGDREATVLLRDNRSFDAVGIHINRDTTSFFTKDQKAFFSFETKDIERFEWRDHLGGALTGLVGGTLGGLATGFGLARVLFGTPSGGEMSGFGHALFMFYATIFGGVGGLVYGTINGQVYVFIVPPGKP